MARIRTIKPEFFTSEDIVSLSPYARLLYIALWCEADKEGRMVWKPKTFKMRYLPGDSVDAEELCSEIVDAGLVVLYGDGLAYVPQFTKHQHVNPRESASTLAVPPDYVPEPPRKITADVRAEVMERDGGRCVRCRTVDDLTLDHILPQCLGGPHIASNLRVMCRSCNGGRAVSGQGLIDDLAKDGLTINELRVKFGLDASPRVATRANQELTHREEGKGREGDRRVVKRRATPLPDGFAISDRVKAWAEQKGHGHLPEQFEALVSYAKRRGATYVDWDEALMTAVREDWAKVNGKSQDRGDNSALFARGDR